MAEYMLIPHPRLPLPLGDLDPRDAAPLSDAAFTPYHAIKRSLHLLVPGSTAVVIGVGGLSHMAVQILRALSPARVIAVDTSAEKLAAARELGADATLEPGPDAAARIRELSGGRGAELVLDDVGTDETRRWEARSAVSRDTSPWSGLAGGKLQFAFGALPFESQLTIPYLGDGGGARRGARPRPDGQDPRPCRALSARAGGRCLRPHARG